MQCDYCGAHVDATATRCPDCGELIKKDVESIKGKNPKIISIARQVESIKNKVDAIYKANLSEKETNILKQVKSVQSSVDKLEKSVLSQKQPSKCVSKNTQSKNKNLGFVDLLCIVGFPMIA